MINPYKIKKTASLVLVGMFTVIFFFVGVTYYGLFIGIGCMMAGLLTSIIVANLLLRTPFTDMLEGKGILVIDLNSTGIIQPTIVGVDPPYIKGKLRKKSILDIFDRKAVYNLKVPVKNDGKNAKNLSYNPETGDTTFRLSENLYNKARFALNQYPVLLYNSQLGSILTKDFLSNQEKTAFAEHHVMFLNEQMKSLTMHVRDFGRYIVEFMRPKGALAGGKVWLIVIIIIVVIILVILFLPKIIETFGGTVEPIQQAAGAAKAGVGDAVIKAGGQ